MNFASKFGLSTVNELKHSLYFDEIMRRDIERVFGQSKVGDKIQTRPFQPSHKRFSAVKGDKDVKFAQNFLKLLLWFLSSIFVLFMINNHANLLVVLD